MTLQQFAKQHNLKVAQVRELCNVLFNGIPDTLTDENIKLLDNALLDAANKALPHTENTELAITNNQEITNSTDKVVRIVGESVLKQNLQLYLTNVKKHFLAQQFEINALHFQIEQNYYSKLSSYQQISQTESINRINKNSQLLTRQGIEALKADSNIPQEDIEILTDIGELMDFFELA